MTPKISVIMSVFNESNTELNESINSILNQDYSNFEFIIVDDNPNSNKIKLKLKNVKKNNNNVRLYFDKRNLGASLARNKGVKYAKGRFLAIMDADDIANKHRLSYQLNFIKSYGLDLIFPNYKIISNNGNVICNQVYHMKSTINQRKIKHILIYINDIALNSGWFLKKNIFNSLNGYRQVMTEDYDFLSRFIKKGYKLGYQSMILMSYRYRPNSIMRQNVLKIYLITKYIKKFLRFSEADSFSVNSLNRYINKNVTANRIRQFNNFVYIGHNLRYKFTLTRFIQLLYYLLTTKFAIRYVLNKLLITFRERKL